AEAAAQATRDIMCSRGGFNDVTGGMDDYEEAGGYEGPNNVTGSGSDEDEESRDPPSHHYRAPFFPATHGSPREEQKVDLINELHNRIGLPQIDHLRKFEPLTSDPRADTKQEELQSELETAKQEADKLRAAVQEMEQCLRLAAQHSKLRSIKLEQQKAQEFAEVQSELDRVREELEVERRRSASLHSGPSSWRSSVASDPGTDESQDTGVMQNLRLSLHKVFRGHDEQLGGANGDHSRRASVQRTSYSHDSPRHTQKTKEQTYDVDEEGMEEDQDGGRRFESGGNSMDGYSRVKLLGEGSFGRVFLMREKKLGGRLVCVKEIYRAHYPKRSAFASRAKSVDVEVDLMKKLLHPNLIRLLSSFVDPSPLRQPHIVMEYCSGGDLRTYLKTHKKQRSCLDEDKIWYWFVQLGLGLHHMHQQRVLH
ncbi:hypothetical protein PI125_g26534, partial [Phytophthora idaei]